MSDREDEREGKGFVVKDRRFFDADGNARPEAEEIRQTPQQQTPQQQTPQQQTAHGYSLPEMDFSTFILSLSTSAMVHLGEVPEPDGSTHKELPLAKQAIDILGMLQEKTKGNLTEEEFKLLDDLLCDLRLRFVEAMR